MPKSKSIKQFLIRALPLMVIDIVGTIAAFFISAYGTNVFDLVMAQPTLLWQLAIFCIVNVVVFFFYGLYSSLWQYASVSEVLRIVVATLISTMLGDILAAVVIGERLPMRVYICEWFILVAVCGASRFLIRIGASRKVWDKTQKKQSDLPRALVIGAGESGSLAIKRMNDRHNAIALNPVAIVDDNPRKYGCLVHGIKVVGTCKDIESVCGKYEINQIVLAIPSATAEQKKAIIDICVKTGLKVLSVPEAVKDMTQEEQQKVVFRDVEISDLLAREEVELDLGQMDYVRGKRVLVTGGGGSIGSELVRQLLPAKPSQIVIFDIYENTSYELYHEISGKAKELGIDLQIVIGSITHMPALRSVFDNFNPEVVFHAAAHKHVPLMEDVPREAIENNIFGTYNVARLAHETHSSHFILISTDKAVNPVNVMGATKRCCEMIIQYFSKKSDTKFAAVRFGNVLGSHGSVIPLFKRQLKEGGPITVTHKDITRYFMTIPEASRLVITAGALANGGEIFVLDMGEPVKIYDLAVNLIKLSGFKVGEGGIEIRVTGLRKGEKLYEELNMSNEPTRPTANGAITVICGMRDEVDTVPERLEYLQSHIEDSNEELKQVLSQTVPTYIPQLTNSDKEPISLYERVAQINEVKDFMEKSNQRRKNITAKVNVNCLHEEDNVDLVSTTV